MAAWFSPATLVTGNSVTATIWNNNFSNMIDSGWQAFYALGYLNSWGNNTGPGPSGNAAYRLIGNRVFFSGRVGGGATGTQLCNALATAYRPATATMTWNGVTTATTISACAVSVTTSGAVTLAFASGAVPAIDGSYTVD